MLNPESQVWERELWNQNGLSQEDKAKEQNENNKMRQVNGLQGHELAHSNWTVWVKSWATSKEVVSYRCLTQHLAVCWVRLLKQRMRVFPELRKTYLDSCTGPLRVQPPDMWESGKHRNNNLGRLSFILVAICLYSPQQKNRAPHTLPPKTNYLQWQ